MEIPNDVRIKATISPGSVYYFTDKSFTSDEPHYFVVLNCSPLLLVCASSQIDKVKRRRYLCPNSTLVEITPDQYPGFSRHSIIDCNFVAEHTAETLIALLDKGELKIKPEMPLGLVNAMISAVLDSPVVAQKVKKWL